MLSEGTGNAAKPTGAACCYRMIAAGSTSLWSLSFRSPSGRRVPPSQSLRPALLSLPCPRSRFLAPSLSIYLLLSLSHCRPAVRSLGEGTPRWSHETRRLLLSPAAFLPFRSSLFRCSACHIFSLSLSLFAFLVSSLSLCRAVAGSLVSSVHRPGLSVFFSLIIPLRAIARVN